MGIFAQIRQMMPFGQRDEGECRYPAKALRAMTGLT